MSGWSQILLEGKLHDAVEPDECFWSLTVERGTQCVELSMRKQAPEFASLGLTAPSQFWPQVSGAFRMSCVVPTRLFDPVSLAVALTHADS